MDILKALGNVDLDDTQIAALDKFFEEYRIKITDDVKQQYSENVDTDKYILREKAEEAFALFESDCEAAFELFEKDAERAFELFEGDAEKAFDLGVEDIQKTYTENMAQALQETYDDIAERVKKDFLESKEYKTIQKLKDLVMPLLEDSDSDLVEKIKSLNEEKEKVEEENKHLAKSNAINTLLKDIPMEYEETVKEFISAGNDEEEVIERFNTIVEMIETKLSIGKPKVDDKEIRFARKQAAPIVEEKVVSAPVKEEKKEESKQVFRSVYEESERREAEIKPLDEKFNAIIDKVFA